LIEETFGRCPNLNT